MLSNMDTNIEQLAGYMVAGDTLYSAVPLASTASAALSTGYAAIDGAFNTVVSGLGAVAPGFVIFAGDVWEGYQIATGDEVGYPEGLGQWLGFTIGVNEQVPD